MPLECRRCAPRMPNNSIICAPGLPRKIPLPTGGFGKSAPRMPKRAFFEFPSGNADRGLGVGKTWYRMPLWLQKSWGPEEHQWTTYGGGGAAVVPQDGYKNYPF